jgi:hypothetical protein
VRVVIGQPLLPPVAVETVQRTQHVLGDWIQHTEDNGETPITAKIPAVAKATPAAPESSLPPRG